MNEFPTILWILFLLGLTIRIVMALLEAKYVRWAWDWVCRPDEEDANGHRATILNRTYISLSAVRLARLVSLLLLVPSALLLIEFHITGTEQPATEVWHVLLVVLGLFFFFVLLSAAMMGGLYRSERTSSRRTSPKWLRDEAQRMPGPVAAGGLLWEWVVRQGQRLAPGSFLQRPKARLYELDEELVMAVGERELGALDARKSERLSATNEKSEIDMIRAIQRLDQTLVREVMRPLNNVTAVSLINLTAEKFLQVARRTGYTRFPCYYDQVTNLIGYLNVHDFLESPQLPKDIRKLVHPCLFIPEVARVDFALQEMLRDRSQIAICYDEFGGCSGLLSREDIIEEITGEIMDEYDRPESRKLEEAHGHYLVDPSIDLDDLKDEIGLDLEKKYCDTLAGYIYQHFSRTPRRGEGFEERGWRLDVVQMDKHRIRRVRITRIDSEEED
jgi:Mg2+/Co2+ transporter CorC